MCGTRVQCTGMIYLYGTHTVYYGESRESGRKKNKVVPSISWDINKIEIDSSIKFFMFINGLIIKI